MQGLHAMEQEPFAYVTDMNGDEVTLFDGHQYSIAVGDGKYRGRFIGQFNSSKSTATLLWFDGEDRVSYLSLPAHAIKDVDTLEAN